MPSTTYRLLCAMSLAAMLSPALAAGQDDEAADIRREERRADALRAKILGLLVGSAILGPLIWWAGGLP